MATTLYDAHVAYDTHIAYGGAPAPGAVSVSLSVPPPVYRVVAVNSAGIEVDEVPASNISFSYVLNGAGSLSFVLPLRHPKCTQTLLNPGESLVHVYRDGVRVWGGYLWTVTAEQTIVRFGCEGWFSRFSRRYIDSNQVFTQVVQEDIAWTLINFTQAKTNGDLGITRGAYVSSGVKRDRTYLGQNRMKLSEALQNLAAVDNGFDFDITPNKEWRTFYPQKGTRLPDASFALGKNIRGYAYQIDAVNMANEITAIGGMDLVFNTPLLATAVAPTQRQQYGLLQDTRSYTDISIPSTLTAHANEDVRLAKDQNTNPQLVVTVSDPPWGSYSVGDSVYVDMKVGYIDIHRFLRLKSMAVNLSNQGNEAVSLYFDEEMSGALS